MTKFGEIEKVDVRSAWAHEQHEFTPWLAEDENMARLSEALGVDLEVEGIEVAVGPYSADILAKDIGSQRYVVIENQFGKTNHDHLGKLITYASFLDASTVVWIAEHFTEEHQKAIDWINDHTIEDVTFYAVAIELWRIDASRPAVRFSVLSRPNELVKQAAATKAIAELSDVRKLQLDFWTAFRDKLLERGVVKTAQTPRPQNWFEVAIGRNGVSLSSIANPNEGRIGVTLYMSHRLADWLLPALEQDKEQIEAEIGECLAWNPNPDKRDKIVALHHHADLADRASWPAYIDWMVERVDRFRKAFSPRVKRMQPQHASSAANLADIT